MPVEAPTELINWIIKKKILPREYIIFSMADTINPLSGKKERMVECRCSACGGVFFADKAETECYKSTKYGWYHPDTDMVVKEWEKTDCPLCGERCTVRHSWRSYNLTAEESFPSMILKIKGRIVVATWRVQKIVDTYGQKSFRSDPYEAYIFDGKKCIKIQGYKKFVYYYYLGRWESRASCRDTFGEKGVLMNFDKRIFNGTELENSKFDIYTRRKECYPVTYLRLYQRHNNVENLVMSGAGYLIDEKIKYISRGGYYYSILSYKTNIEGVNWKAKRPCDMLGLSKEEFKKMVKEEKLSDEWISIYAYAKSKGVMLSPSEMTLIRRRFTNMDLKMLLDYAHLDGARYFLRAVRYLNKQREKYKGDNISCHELKDYWDMMRTLGEELSCDAIIFPQRLKNAHDVASVRLTAKKNEAKNEEVKKRFKLLRRLSFNDGDFLIFPAPTVESLAKEGKELHHCVATYTDKYARGDTAIFFIREKTKPKDPFYTLELDEKNALVRQNRGLRNCGKTKEVQEFENAFMERVRGILLKESKNRKGCKTA